MDDDPADGDLVDVASALFSRPAEEGVSLALVVQQGGEILVERYGERSGSLFNPEPASVDADTPLDSSTAAESIVHAAVGVLVADGRLDLAASAPVAARHGNERELTTVLDLLEMWWGPTWNRSTATTNLVATVIGNIVGGGEQAMREFLDERLFGPTGMMSADPRFDPAGMWIGTSLFATATDFARFGELYLRDGMVGGDRVLPEGWANHARTRVAVDPESGFGYGRHWWIWPDQPKSLAAHGDEGQYIVVIPERDAVIVHLGETHRAMQAHLADRLRVLIRCL